MLIYVTRDLVIDPSEIAAIERYNGVASFVTLKNGKHIIAQLTPNELLDAISVKPELGYEGPL